MKQILFFSLRSDLIPVVETVEKITQLKYIRTGNCSIPQIEPLSSALDIPDLGKANFGTASGCASYLVCKRDTAVNIRSVATAGGTPLFLVDQLMNPDTVVFTPAGVWSEDILLHGRVATNSHTAHAQELMKLFHTAFSKKFTKVRAFYVGPQALNWLRSGKRLTISDQSSREFDLAPTA